MLAVVWEAIIGLVVGALAKLVMPGKDPGGIWTTMALGIAGSHHCHLAGQAGRLVFRGPVGGIYNVDCRCGLVAVSLPGDSWHARQVVTNSRFSKSWRSSARRPSLFTRLQEDRVINQLDCAQHVVKILFEKTGLSTILRKTPNVIVGAGNWISFAAHQAVLSEVILGLATSCLSPAFFPDWFSKRRKARSRTSPSLHLTNLDSDEALQGHVDAHYWGRNPLAHAYEFLRKKTTPPSELLERLEDLSMRAR